MDFMQIFMNRHELQTVQIITNKKKEMKMNKKKIQINKLIKAKSMFLNQKKKIAK